MAGYLKQPLRWSASLPWYFKLAKWMLRKDIAGSWRFMSYLDELGFLNRTYGVPFLEGSTLLVPLNWKWFWQYQDLVEYEPNTLRTFSAAINEKATGCAALFLDCGAHIGLVSHYIDKCCVGVDEIHGFEPNENTYLVLSENLRKMRATTRGHKYAIGNHPGRAALTVSGDDEDGSFIESDEEGPIEIHRLDDLNLDSSKGLVMKIDVEGYELAVLQGAERMIREAPYFVIMFEAHKEVMRRTGVDPMECVRFLRGIRGCSWKPSAQDDVTLSIDEPFFDQIGNYNKRDIIVISSD